MGSDAAYPVRPSQASFFGILRVAAQPTRLLLQKSRSYKLAAQADAEQVSIADEISNCTG